MMVRGISSFAFVDDRVLTVYLRGVYFEYYLSKPFKAGLAVDDCPAVVEGLLSPSLASGGDSHVATELMRQPAEFNMLFRSTYNSDGEGGFCKRWKYGTRLSFDILHNQFRIYYRFSTRYESEFHFVTKFFVDYFSYDMWLGRRKDECVGIVSWLESTDDTFEIDVEAQPHNKMYLNLYIVDHERGTMPDECGLFVFYLEDFRYLLEDFNYWFDK
ncbi:MAG: hypothetical protein KatS3mg087_0478 [Patescibacteria group bacterium]|nr:MAG: hypothetical protein KatS3mg087_0478 [Patescibacteria group bacterium]